MPIGRPIARERSTACANIATRRSAWRSAPCLQSSTRRSILSPSDAVDEAIELIEALIFPEEMRFRTDHPLIEDAIHLEDVPYALGLDTATGVMPIEIVEEVVSAAPQAAMPVDLAAEAVIDEPQPQARAETEAIAVAPAAKPGLFAPVAAAGRSLAAILARRKAAAAAVAEARQAAVLPAAPQAASTPVEAALATPESEGAVVASLAAVQSEAADVATTGSSAIDAHVETSTANAAVIAQAVATQLTAVRQRLVDVIAARAQSGPAAAAFEPSAPEPGLVADNAPAPVDDSQELAADRVSEPSSPDLLARSIEIAPVLPPAVLQNLDEEPPAQCGSGVQMPAVEAEDAQPETDAAPVPATEDFDSERNALTAMTGNSEVVPEMALTNADTKVAAPADPEPTRRKRPRRKSRRKAAPRKRRTK